MIDLTKLAHEIHADNVAKGFYEQFNEVQRVLRLNYGGTDPLAVYVRNALKNQQLMLIVTELAEACEATRVVALGVASEQETKEMLSDYKKGELTPSEYAAEYKVRAKDRLQAELAGTFIRLMDFCGCHNIDIGLFVEAELAYNKTRPYRHGKAC